ncbi:ribonuclease domain-containing protein [Chryseobacterium sp.]|uniref:ribonuclease domain-containing protein n=1 Tax=Chryseobacterium sp. TaxID=1871047 RepID=UPI0011CC8875|nr:ribonuclease domain-containing protein [Chryseobacterium sp.]TXF74904.1 ribonuclease N [Chryseobacterium sp.]
MNKDKIRLFLLFVIGLLSAFLLMHLFSNNEAEKNTASDSKNIEITTGQQPNISEKTAFSGNIAELTAENTVINHVKVHKKLPNYYMTKTEARNKGWIASEGNLCNVLPGRAIGGDTFSNREKHLPKGEQYFEADVNYHCGSRNADRIIFTKNGDVWLSKDHYRSFEKQ